MRSYRQTGKYCILYDPVSANERPPPHNSLAVHVLAGVNSVACPVHCALIGWNQLFASPSSNQRAKPARGQLVLVNKTGSAQDDGGDGASRGVWPNCTSGGSVSSKRKAFSVCLTQQPIISLLYDVNFFPSSQKQYISFYVSLWGRGQMFPIRPRASRPNCGFLLVFARILFSF